MRDAVTVCLIDGPPYYERIDRAACEKYPRTGKGSSSKTIQINGDSVTGSAYIASQLVGERVAPGSDQVLLGFGEGGFGRSGFGGRDGRIGKIPPSVYDLYCENARDRWFIEAKWDRTADAQEYYFQLTYDEAGSWLVLCQTSKLGSRSRLGAGADARFCLGKPQITTLTEH